MTAHISLERSLANDSWLSPGGQINSTLNRVKNKLNTQTLNKFNRTKSIESRKQIVQLVDEQPVEIYCEVIGSRPAVTFSWYLGDQKLPSNHYTQWPPSNSRAPLTSTLTSRTSSQFNNNPYSVHSNQTINVNSNLNGLNKFTTTALISNQHLAISTLHFKPTADADGKQLTCRAENSLLSDHRLSSIETHVQLDVQCKFIIYYILDLFFFTHLNTGVVPCHTFYSKQ